ncbi:chemotaxis-specific protein-glutamate methyltransferase CheB [Acetobacteraceae bacterium H6797]|nr:chemotaxis-specific protein-glutamate methyltransferase CheB [Acetobacteraceae bacterium H6797]
MLCDDSATVRAAMARMLEADPEISVVARVGNGQAALTAMADAKPDVVLLDLEMPVMDGMTALPLLLKQDPALTVIVASALTQRGAAATMAAMRAGAADYMPKPNAASGGLADEGFRGELLAKIKGWARMRRRRPVFTPAAIRVSAPPAPPPRPAAMPMTAALMQGRPRVIAIGCSTGGPQALAALVKRLAHPPPVPIVVVQHMPAGFTAMLADHLNRLGGPKCAEAQDGEVLRAGHLYIAPGDRHLLVNAQGDALVAKLTSDPPENFCRPAVDPMFRSLCAAVGGRVLAVILTGMGQDGLLGARAIAQAGGTILAQDEASSVVWGMPGAVSRAGLAQALMPPEALGDRLLSAFTLAPAGGRA